MTLSIDHSPRVLKKYSITEAPLSRRECEILQLVAQGCSNLQIGRHLFISPNTVKVHMRNIFEKMQVRCRTEAAMVAVERG